MKKAILAATVAAAALLSGCAAAPYQHGFIYTNQSTPLDVRDNATACTKRGESSTTNILGLFAFGDAGLEAAKKAGGITKVGSVDMQQNSFFGIFSTSTTVVCGE